MIKLEDARKADELAKTRDVLIRNWDFASRSAIGFKIDARDKMNAVIPGSFELIVATTDSDHAADLAIAVQAAVLTFLKRELAGVEEAIRALGVAV